MAPIPRRRLTLLDSMILIVAMASVLPASVQVMRKATRPIDLNTIMFASNYGEYLWREIRSYTLGLSACLGSLTIALTALQWRRPKLAFRLLGRSPGLAASGVATVVLLLEAAVGLEMGGVRFLEDYAIWWLPFSTRNAGGAVAGVWLTLATTGRWRRTRGDLDRLGLLLGICWIATYLLTFYSDDFH